MQASRQLLQRLLKEVQTMNIRQLRKYFEELMGFPPRSDNRETLRRRISYKLQERTLGGLPPDDSLFLDELAANDPLANIIPGVVLDYRPGMRIVRGTRFTREWHGKTYVATYMARNKYLFEGNEYRSLTAVSSLITGTHWSGTNFFGVKHDD